MESTDIRKEHVRPESHQGLSLKKTVVVTGDLLWDVNLVQYPMVPRHLEPMPHTVLHRQAGGAWYLEDILRMACSDLDIDIRAPKGIELPNEAYCIWSLHEQMVGSKSQTWRVREFLGCKSSTESYAHVTRSGDTPSPDVLVLDDLCLGFRERRDFWPAALMEGGSPRRIVLKTCAPLAEGPLWKKLLSDFADRLTVVLHVSALRARGAAISQSLSWDLAIEETVREFEDGISAQDLGRCQRVIAHFGSAGAASFTRCPLALRPPAKAHSTSQVVDQVRFERFLYHPEDLEQSWESKRPGILFGATSVLAGAIVRHELQPVDYPLYIALGRALAAMRVNHEWGGGPPESFSTRAPLEEIKRTLHPPKKAPEPAASYYTAFPHQVLDDPLVRNQPASQSDLLRDLMGAGFEYAVAKATEVVLRGPREALRGAPSARYGKYLTVDRQEIERINAIRNLIISYQKNPEDRRPLCLAVFGPPGSGKSFAIKQLASDLFGPNISVLDFNLSQFASVGDLHTAFNQIRDASVQRQIPFVFWDEFDTDSLKWLKEFLAPMQDSEFRAGGIAYPFGKAIFVFAGGTSSRFEVFDKTNAGGEVEERFRTVKGPDFISRLRGFVNIKGPNPTGSSQSDKESPGQADAFKQREDAARRDPAHLIRRAIILRTAIERFCAHLIDPKTDIASISTSVLRGFLRVKEYIHGARSLESVVSMSNLTPARHFGVAELPSQDLLRLHVTPDFLEHVQEGQLEVSMMEALAEACHEGWRQQRVREGWRYGAVRDDENKLHPLLRPYSELSESDKERNRKPARLTHAKLLALGYQVLRKAVDSQRISEVPRFSEDEQQRLMRTEHDIWLREHLLHGFEWAEHTDEHLRLHFDIAPFENVPPEDQNLDRAIVNSIPDTLWRNGYTLALHHSNSGGVRAPRASEEPGDPR